MLNGKLTKKNKSRTLGAILYGPIMIAWIIYYPKPTYISTTRKIVRFPFLVCFTYIYWVFWLFFSIFFQDKISGNIFQSLLYVVAYPAHLFNDVFVNQLVLDLTSKALVIEICVWWTILYTFYLFWKFKRASTSE